MEINYNKLFPEKLKAELVFDTWVIRAELFNPKDDNYDFTTSKGCNSINIASTFNDAIMDFQKMKVRKKDLATLTNPAIRTKDIIFTLNIRSDAGKDTVRLIGNTISKFLFHKANWSSIVHNSNTANNHKLLTLEIKQI